MTPEQTATPSRQALVSGRTGTDQGSGSPGWQQEDPALRPAVPPTEPAPGAAPVGYLSEVADELRWTFSERRRWLIGIVFNLVIAGVYVGYAHDRPLSHDIVHIAGIATGGAVWVLADVINTNQLGADSDRVATQLEGGHGIVHELALKNSALAVLLLPLTVLISVSVRLVLDRWRAIPHAVVLDVGVVFLWLGIGNVVSVLLPYSPVSLRDRWRARRSLPRWDLCLAAPYLALLSVRWLAWPADRVLHHRLFGRPEAHLMSYALVYMSWGLALWGI
ncbi:MAG: hypothetical protein ACLQPH_13255 [Acidimicrobiales bacterium]